MERAKPACGPHRELVRTEGVRISRCACGTVHVSFSRNGITVQLAPEHFVEAAQAMSLARSLLVGEPVRVLRTRVDAPLPGRFVSITSVDPKRTPNN